jgi:hypothetical protein
MLLRGVSVAGSTTVVVHGVAVPDRDDDEEEDDDLGVGRLTG